MREARRRSPGSSAASHACQLRTQGFDGRDDSRADGLDVGVGTHQRRHGVDEVAERTHPDTCGDSGIRGHGDVDLVVEFDDADRTARADVTHAYDVDQRSETSRQRIGDVGNATSPRALEQ